jgi:selenocysteine-specific elongation factor
VDVPGHERFVRNMLAGAGGIDAVLLVVAADESVMPQTREHFEICRLLRVPAGLIVVTKSDAADPATLEVVRLEIADLVEGSFLQEAPVLAVSARTGAGIPELRRTLARFAQSTRPRPCDGPPRLPIDRVFSIKGFGTVVTGTLIAGQLHVDQELVLQPSGRRVKVRGLQVHGERQFEAAAGQRVAVNLAGVEVADVTRGETLAQPDAVTVTRHADVRLELLASAKPLRHGARIRFHQGTRELLGRVALPDSPDIQPGTSGFARLHLEAPAVLVRGDRFILRAYSPLATIGGGTVLDPLPPRRGVRTATGVARFAKLSETESIVSAVMTMIEEVGLSGLSEAQLIGRAGVRWSDRDQPVAQLERQAVRIGGVLVSASRLAAVEEAMLGAIAQYHADHPLEPGIPREELRERLFGEAPIVVFEEALRVLVDRRRIVARERVALTAHSVELTDEEARARAAIVQILDEAELTPPDIATLAARAGLQAEVVDRIAKLLVREKVLVRAGDLLFHEAAIRRLKTEVRSLKQTGEAATFDVAAFKDRYHVTRKYAIPLLELLDRERITRRVGETRHIL